MTQLILGLDCGGTKTAAALAMISSHARESVHFEILGRGGAGPSNPCSVGEEIAYENVHSAIREAFHNANQPQQTVASIALCMAGVGRPEEMEHVRRWTDSQKLAERAIVTEDVEPVRWAAIWETGTRETVIQEKVIQEKVPGSASSIAIHPSLQRIVTLISGTGSIACCTDRDLRNQRVGGWGYLLGDEGSGFAIGLQGLKNICAAHDRDLPLSLLHRELLEAMQCSNPMQLIPRVYQFPLPRPEIAQLSRIVLRHAGTDSQAANMVQSAAESLSLLVRMALHRARAGNDPYLLAVSGGLLESESPLLGKLQQDLEFHQLAPSRVHLVQRPVHGALYMAALALQPTDASFTNNA